MKRLKLLIMLILVFLLVGCEEQIKWDLPPSLRYGEDSYKPFYENRGKVVLNDKDFKVVGKIHSVISVDKGTEDADAEYEKLVKEGIEKPIILCYFPEEYQSLVGTDVYQGIGEYSKYLIIEDNVSKDKEYEVYEYIEPPKD
ncbi:MAG: hypothetical protein GXY87_03425 [Tissierellia bacterium]|nr:hypothetical protein [Tissierellia bacterium]